MKLLSMMGAAVALATSAIVAQAQEGTVNATVEVQAPAAEPSVQGRPAAPRPEGQWIYTEEYGWVWVPAGAAAATVGEQPYVYLYTPSFGWTWYVSPWGWGPFYYGPWVHRPWAWHYAPRVWGGHAWIAPRAYVWPHAYGGEHFGYRGVYHGGYHGGGFHRYGGGGFHGGSHGHR